MEENTFKNLTLIIEMVKNKEFNAKEAIQIKKIIKILRGVYERKINLLKMEINKLEKERDEKLKKIDDVYLMGCSLEDIYFLDGLR